MTQRCAAFDMDGTLIDSLNDITNAVNRMRASYGFPPILPEQVRVMIGDGARELVSRATNELDMQVDQVEALTRYRAEYDAALTVKTVLYPGAMEGLCSLRNAGFRLAVFTNKPAKSAKIILTDLGCVHLFDCIIGNGSGFPMKPAPDALLHIAETLQCDASYSFMVGDNWTDVQSANRAGFRSVFCSYGYGTPRTDIPKLTCTSFPDVVSRILSDD